ncbi:hypothetical protein [Urbifossiella limnaea]|uniref:DUF2007 domain-containing protein n=1 Tax=Urbifossiella limnaea TaxID=2528023 RepID=A0A517XM49_9BACT|nr:hypothetical protein [Urbifossiella limnaea]QDU18588.1 hypothetical protein ETAA1_04810 [Urbifossiella limnaea]
MGTKLVTIATFDQVVMAQMAADALRAGGIDAVVTDAEVVSMDWLLGQAVGGIKVQVREDDAERAVVELGRKFGDDGEGFGAEYDEGADEPEPDDEPEPAAGCEDEPEPAAAPVGSRDEYARRLVLAAVFGLLLPPLWFYAVYLFLNAAFGEGELSDYGRNKLFIGTFVLALGFPMSLFILYLPFFILYMFAPV